ncbi:MAG: N-acetylmuramoyl-L-alanine amidase [Muribaculaceae bacterium]|nr:N-acetylmuramoyl-L-alanine amidase [Muribaculaceae bacterium]
MKKILLLAAAAIIAASTMVAQTPDQLRVYLNPGHGSWGPNDRPMPTIPYPNLASTGRPDTCGFYESNTNLWKVLRMGEVLERMGVSHSNIMYSRVKNGPYPYVSGATDEELYNRNLTEIAREVDANNMDIFVSVHSNAADEGTTTNYPLYLYRGQDYNANGYEHNEGSYEMCDANWGPHFMDELDPQNYYTRTKKNIRGDWNFYGKTYQTTTSKGTFTGYLGVLRHGTPGFLVEGYFHTYQPARHRALNPDYCYQEGTRLARGLCDYFNLTPEPTGYIMGTIKDKNLRINNPLYTYASGTDDQWMPLNGATVRLLKDGQVVDTYIVDNNYNGLFVFENLEPGDYTLDASCEGYDDLDEEYKGAIHVNANETVYPKLYLTTIGYLKPETFFKNYPDPDQPTGLEMPDSFEFTVQNDVSMQMQGTVKRAVVRGDSTYVLTNSGMNAYIYIVDNATQQIVGQVPTGGLHVDTNNLGFYSPLNDITFTADGKLVGVNSVRCQSQDRFVDDGYKRGMLYYYKWNHLDEDPVIWIQTDNSASLYRGDMGQSFVVSGNSSNCTIATTGVHSTNGSIRVLVQKFYDGAVVNTYYTERSNSATHPFSKSLAGNKYRLTLSATDDTHLGGDGLIVNGNNFVLDGELIAPHEFTLAASTSNSEDIGDISNELVDVASVGVSFFRYLDHAMMVVPTVADNAITGVKVLDVTDGFNNATEITTLGSTLAQGINMEDAYVGTGAQVNGADVDLYLFVNNEMIKFTKGNALKTGDITGEGVVDVADVNAIINIILND